MSAEMVGLAGGRRQESPRRSGTGLRPVAGVLADGAAFYAPVGEVVVEGSLVTCHLCGRSFRSVAAHLSAHGWTKQQYCEAFGLERGQSLEGPETRKLRAAAFTARLLFEPAVRQGSATGPAAEASPGMRQQRPAAGPFRSSGAARPPSHARRSRLPPLRRPAGTVPAASSRPSLTR